MKKSIIKTAAFLLILFVSLYLTDSALRLKSSDGFVEERFYEDLGRMNRLYKDPEGGGDAVS